MEALTNQPNPSSSIVVHHLLLAGLWLWLWLWLRLVVLCGCCGRLWRPRVEVETRQLVTGGSKGLILWTVMMMRREWVAGACRTRDLFHGAKMHAHIVQSWFAFKRRLFMCRRRDWTPETFFRLRG